MRYWIVAVLIAALLALAAAAWFEPFVWIAVVLLSPIVALALRDFFQHGNNIRRNYPFLGTINETLLKQRHIIQELVLQKSWEGRPLSQLQMRLVAKRAADELTNEPFGTEMDYDAAGHDWLKHSIYPTREVDDDLRIRVGGPHCRAPYSASRFNIAAMSFGSISSHATRALADGAKIGNFAMNTGEGGITDHHWQSDADLIWQIGTGYFGCRNEEGGFDPAAYEELATNPQVKMIELKISQGAKPAFGAILPASKNTEEVARYRGIEPHEEVLSPADHPEFSDAAGLLAFVDRMRDLSGGKPVGIKLCLGERDEFEALCEAMRAAGTAPDYIVVAGGEGGSASLDAIHHVGAPGEESLVFVHDCLSRFGLRDDVRVFYAGKIVSGFDVVRSLCLGADVCYSARGMMIALGCVQSLKCNTNHCPTGITTMDPARVAGLSVQDKRQKVANYHRNTLEGVRKLVAAAGLERVGQLGRRNLERRIGPASTRSLAELYPYASSTPA